MVRLGNFVVMNGDVLLRAQLIDQLLDRIWLHDRVTQTLNEDTAGGAGRQEREIVHVCGRRDGDEAADFGPAHQQLHADERAERYPRHPGGLRLRMDLLHPVERARRVG